MELPNPYLPMPYLQQPQQYTQAWQPPMIQHPIQPMQQVLQPVVMMHPTAVHEAPHSETGGGPPQKAQDGKRGANPPPPEKAASQSQSDTIMQRLNLQGQLLRIAVTATAGPHSGSISSGAT